MRPMARGWRRAALGGARLAAVLAAGALAVPSGPVAAEPSRRAAADGSCEGKTGVTVVVDFGTLGGGMQTRCAPEPVSSGFDALEKAGFTVTPTAQYPGLLCRIDGKPADDPCRRAPKSSYYWAYWTASSPGGTWAYSQEGGGTRVPPQGSVEGWAFSDGCTRKPGASITCPSATTTSTASPSTTRPATSGGVAVTATTAPHTATTAGGSGQTTVVASGEGEAAPREAREALGRADQVRDQDSDGVALARGDTAPDASPGGGGSPAGALAGATVAALLGLAAAGRLRQRRRSSLAGSGAE